MGESSIPVVENVARQPRSAGGCVTGGGFFSGRGLAIRATLRAPAPRPQMLTLRRRDPSESGWRLCALLAGPLWTRNLSVSSSGANSVTVACRMTASDRFGVVQKMVKRATRATWSLKGSVADGRGHVGPWQKAPSVARPMFPDLGSGKMRHLAITARLRAREICSARPQD
jgi:hypothetical protein